MKEEESETKVDGIDECGMTRSLVEASAAEASAVSNLENLWHAFSCSSWPGLSSLKVAPRQGAAPGGAPEECAICGGGRNKCTRPQLTSVAGEDVSVRTSDL